jgi:hypothetical protein
VLLRFFALVAIGLPPEGVEVSPTTTAGQGEHSLRWRHLSSKKGDLPAPGPSTQQTGAVVADLDQDGLNDFVLSFREQPPALVWYRRNADGWDRWVIESGDLTIEAGGAVFDIDGDGDLDLVFGADYQDNKVWWWENPCPAFHPERSWNRRLIKGAGGNQHHDQIFGDFLGTGKPQLAFWNQGDRRLLLAKIPANPRQQEPWSHDVIWEFAPPSSGRASLEGLAVEDLDGDGQLDLLAGHGWLKHRGDGLFEFIAIGGQGGRLAAGRFRNDQPRPQVVIAPGDGIGPLMFYECAGSPTDSSAWTGRKLVQRDLVHGHTLQLGDLDGDGNLDIFAAEMAKWREQRGDLDHPGATAWILFGDGRGSFRPTVFCVGMDFHEARVADLDGDGDLDVLNKPYTWDAPRVDVWLQEK